MESKLIGKITAATANSKTVETVKGEDIEKVVGALRDYANSKKMQYTTFAKAFLKTGDKRDNNDAYEALGTSLGVLFAAEMLSALAHGKGTAEIVDNLDFVTKDNTDKARKKNDLLAL